MHFIINKIYDKNSLFIHIFDNENYFFIIFDEKKQLLNIPYKVSKKTIEETKATSMYELVNKVPGAIMVNLGNEQHSMAIRQPMTTNSYFLYLEESIV